MHLLSASELYLKRARGDIMRHVMTWPRQDHDLQQSASTDWDSIGCHQTLFDEFTALMSLQTQGTG